MAMARNMPIKAWDFIKSKLVISVTINDSDPMFKALTAWIESNGHGEKSRTLIATIFDDYGDKKVQVSPYKSSFIAKHNGKRFVFSRFSRELKPGKDMNVIESEGYRISMLGFSRQPLVDMLNHIYDEFSRSSSGVMVYNSFHGLWSSCRKINKRPLNTVTLPGDIVKNIVSDISDFLESEEKYNRKGEGWHRGYLFHGVPGSGKTSLALAIASELKMPIYNLWLSSCYGDNYLMDLVSKVPPRSIILMEDVDCVMPTRETHQSNPTPRNLTLTAVLNVLDGICSSNGCVVIMTTNHKENLDPAVLRSGRVDVSIEFSNATEQQVLDYISNNNLDVKLDTVRECVGKPMSDVQEILRSRF